jgi:predicted nucleic acid-binding protein
VAIKFCIDSNILLYTIGEDITKARRAKELVEQRPTISVQTLNEYANVCRKKLKLSWPEIEFGLVLAKEFCDVVPMTLEVHAKAVETAFANRIGIYDACVVAAAELAGCDVLYTEDLNDGQRIGRVTIRNPFK